MLVMLDDQNPFTVISEEIDSVYLSDMHCISSEDLYAIPRWLDIQRICRELIEPETTIFECYDWKFRKVVDFTLVHILVHLML